MRFRPVSIALILFGMVAICLADCSQALANRHRRAYRQAQWYPWHGPYYHTGWGSPVALVIPPTASLETSWGWGVTNTRVSRVNHQFTRPHPGFYGTGGFLPTPRWPSDTRQFGVYNVRGPW
jgi:hypothetical protein